MYILAVTDDKFGSSTSLCSQSAPVLALRRRLRWASSKLTVSIARTRIAAVADTNTWNSLRTDCPILLPRRSVLEAGQASEADRDRPRDGTEDMADCRRAQCLASTYQDLALVQACRPIPILVSRRNQLGRSHYFVVCRDRTTMPKEKHKYGPTVS